MGLDKQNRQRKHSNLGVDNMKSKKILDNIKVKIKYLGRDLERYEKTLEEEKENGIQI